MTLNVKVPRGIGQGKQGGVCQAELRARNQETRRASLRAVNSHGLVDAPFENDEGLVKQGSGWVGALMPREINFHRVGG